jgi:hypothetical protein
MIKDIRDGLNKELALGSDRFKDEIEANLIINPKPTADAMRLMWHRSQNLATRAVNLKAWKSTEPNGGCLWIAAAQQFTTQDMP